MGFRNAVEHRLHLDEIGAHRARRFIDDRLGGFRGRCRFCRRQGGEPAVDLIEMGEDASISLRASPFRSSRNGASASSMAWARSAISGCLTTRAAPLSV